MAKPIYGGKAMKILIRSTLAGCLVSMAIPTLAAPPSDPLDEKYGVPSQPAYIKHYEADKTGKVWLNPYLQMATVDFPAVLDPKNAPYNWVIDINGRVGLIQEAPHPLGRTYEKGFFRPEDQSERKPGTTENYGHPSALGGAPGRISGEILYDKGAQVFIINNKSGRYTKHNTDRTPEQLAEAAKLIRASVDTGKSSWGPVFFLLEYASEDTRNKLMKDPRLAYDDPKKKSRPHIIVMEGAVGQVQAEKASGPVSAPTIVAPKPEAAIKSTAAPAPKGDTAPAKGKKVKAAHNDDPS